MLYIYASLAESAALHRPVKVLVLSIGLYLLLFSFEADYSIESEMTSRKEDSRITRALLNFILGK